MRALASGRLNGVMGDGERDDDYDMMAIAWAVTHLS